MQTENKVYNIALLPGDGIGPEIIKEAVKVLRSLLKEKISFTEALIGGAAFDATGETLPQETIDVCKKSNAILLGAVGGPKWDTAGIRIEHGLLELRKHFNLFANLRPIKIFKDLIDASPLKKEKIEKTDILIVRELTGGIYFGQPRALENDRAFNTMSYDRAEIKRIAEVAFAIARKRNRKVTSVDKANVLEVSKLWRKTVVDVARDYSDVESNHLYVDNAAMQLIVNPTQFDVIVTSNLFGDILSDEASVISGSIGLLPSASLGDSKFGLYEPIHGSAPDIAGQNIANPLATILSAAMMLKYSLELEDESEKINQAIEHVLSNGYRTKDIMNEGCKLVSTSEMGDLVIKSLP